MREVVDDRGEVVRVRSAPSRIVSLVPSTTETLFDLGLGDRVVGVTRFCERPSDCVKGLPKVGGTKDVDPAGVAALRPDLVVGNAEENTAAAFDALAGTAPLYVAFPRTIEDAVADLRRLGRLLDVEDAVAPWADRIEAGAAALDRVAAGRPRRRVAALIWRGPWMAVGADTFAAAVLARAGLDVVPADAGRYPSLDAADLRALDPDLVLLLSEPFPFRARHADELAAATGLPRDRLRAVDGQLLTWHGTRLARALPALAEHVARGFPEVA